MGRARRIAIALLLAGSLVEAITSGVRATTHSQAPSASAAAAPCDAG